MVDEEDEGDDDPELSFDPLDDDEPDDESDEESADDVLESLDEEAEDEADFFEVERLSVL